MIKFVPINEENFKRVISLEVTDNQKNLLHLMFIHWQNVIYIVKIMMYFLMLYKMKKKL